MPKLIAREKFYYAGRNIQADEEFEAEQNDVALLTDAVSPRARHPSPAKVAQPVPEQARAPQPQPVTEPAPRKADTHEVTPLSAADVPGTTPQRRTYTRRDLKAAN